MLKELDNYDIILRRKTRIIMEITLPAIIENVEKVTAFVNTELEKAKCSVKTKAEIDMAIDEVFSNIANYAYDLVTGKATIQIEMQDNPQAIVIKFIDEGKPFDPLKKKDPDVTLSAEKREIGGLGIFMVKKSMDDIKYEYKDNKNILTIKKFIK